MVDSMPAFEREGLKQKQELIRGLLFALVKDAGDFPKQYRSVKGLYVQFRQWAAGEGVGARLVEKKLISLIEKMQFNDQEFKRYQQYYALGGSGGFFVDVASKSLVLDANAESPQASVAAFLRGAMLFLKSTETDIDNLREQLFRLNQEIDDFESSVFEEDSDKVDEILELRSRAFKQADSHKNDLLKVLEENAIGQ
jgi:hypothetical protein